MSLLNQFRQSMAKPSGSPSPETEDCDADSETSIPESIHHVFNGVPITDYPLELPLAFGPD